jgi:hypothetical protein
MLVVLSIHTIIIKLAFFSVIIVITSHCIYRHPKSIVSLCNPLLASPRRGIPLLGEARSG